MEHHSCSGTLFPGTRPDVPRKPQNKQTTRIQSTPHNANIGQVQQRAHEVQQSLALVLEVLKEVLHVLAVKYLQVTGGGPTQTPFAT